MQIEFQGRAMGTLDYLRWKLYLIRVLNKVCYRLCKEYAICKFYRLVVGGHWHEVDIHWLLVKIHQLVLIDGQFKIDSQHFWVVDHQCKSAEVTKMFLEKLTMNKCMRLSLVNIKGFSMKYP